MKVIKVWNTNFVKNVTSKNDGIKKWKPVLIIDFFNSVMKGTIIAFLKKIPRFTKS